ncbi:34566_t:CDS:2 [Gigaspora margarita]|uniref:34566_t:CDS:1 n=1 Tax=Gigaspora margarita TaxID=4874 RepID=A0ABM8W4H1_GIGMA|nr:34566_t:CDS:2 [Gigaspora margarita]
MEASREFEAIQESFTKRLNKQDEEVASKIDRPKKVKRKHIAKGENELKSGENDLTMQNEERMLAERLEEELKKDSERQVAKEKEKPKLSYSEGARGPAERKKRVYDEE